MGSVNTLDGKSPRLKEMKKYAKTAAIKRFFYIVRFVF